MVRCTIIQSLPQTLTLSPSSPDAGPARLEICDFRFKKSQLTQGGSRSSLLDPSGEDGLSRQGRTDRLGDWVGGLHGSMVYTSCAPILLAIPNCERARRMDSSSTLRDKGEAGFIFAPLVRDTGMIYLRDCCGIT